MNKASELLTTLTGAGLTEDVARLAVLDAIQKGEAEDDLGLTKGKASAMAGTLAKAGVKAELADTMIKGMIARGELTDDRENAQADALNGAVESVLDELEKGRAELEATGEAPEAPEFDENDTQADKMMKAAVAVTEATDRALAVFREVGAVLVKGYEAMARSDQATVQANAALRTDIAKALGEIGDLKKSFGETIPPRASAYNEIRHPGEQGQNGQPTSDLGAKRDSFIAKARTLIEDPKTPAERKAGLVRAVSQAVNNFDINTLAVEHGIAL